jgi:hypothetical protein
MRRRKRHIKKLAEQLTELQAIHPQATVELWAEDEHRLGLKPILRRIWAKRGQRPIVLVRPRYQWTYLVGFVRPTTGQTYWLLLPTVSVAAFSRALTEFAQHLGAGPDKHILLVLDQAGWHLSRKVTVPEGVHFAPLPPYSPELQPAERLWLLSDTPLVNRVFPDLAALEEVQVARCQQLRTQPERIQAHTCFHWWPDDR